MPGDVGEDRVRVRIPGEQHAVLRHLRAVLDHQGGAERHVEPGVHGELARAVLGPVCRGLEHQLAFVAGDDLLVLRRLDEHQPVAVLDHALDLGLARRLLGDARRGAADVEGPQRELRARLADRLRGQDADRFAQVHHVHGREVAAVAHAADARAGPRTSAPSGSSPSRCPASSICCAVSSSICLPGLDQHLGDGRARPARADRSTSSSATMPTMPLAQRLDDVLALLQGGHLEAENRAAILLGDRDVLRHVHQSAREVAGVGRLERRVGQSLAGAVRRDEVLEHRRALRGSST